MEGKENLDMEAKESRAGVAIHILDRKSVV